MAAASRSLSETESNYACIERECLALTWACDRFRMYIMGLTVVLETDHKPLIPILSTKDVNNLSPRLQRLRLRLMRYDYTIRHVPGKDNAMADLLSRNPGNQLDGYDEVLELSTETFSRCAVQFLPVTSPRLDEIKRAQKLDEICQKVTEFCKTSWPKFLSSTETILKPYWDVQHELALHDGLLLRGNNRIVIPSSERLDVLQRIHVGHLGITKCRERAKDCVWWPGMSSAIESMVKSCRRCCESQPVKCEPLKPTYWPEGPWHTLGSDLFEYKGSQYLVLVDYYSRYPEVAKLESATSSCVIAHIKSIFGRHGIPFVVRSDNGPCYASVEFAKFAKEYDFTHVTSSPRYPQANGEAERFVRTVKSLLKKSDDPYLALLSYRNTPIANGESPARLLMNRTLRTTLPTVSANLKAEVPNRETLRLKEHDYKNQMAHDYDRRHRVKEHSTLDSGQPVVIRDLNRPGVVVSDQHRSVEVETATGNLTRNRRDVVPIPTDCATGTPITTGSPGSTPMRREPSQRIRNPPQRYGFEE